MHMYIITLKSCKMRKDGESDFLEELVSVCSVSTAVHHQGVTPRYKSHARTHVKGISSPHRHMFSSCMQDAQQQMTANTCH